MIPEGALSGTITITPVDDSLDEISETVELTLGTPTNGTLGATTVHTVSLTDDDPQPTVAFQVASQSSGENAGAFTLTVELSRESGLDVTVPYTVAGTAVDPDDYVIDPSPLMILAGSTSGQITITPADDSEQEYAETVELTLGVPTNAGLGATTLHTATIDDDDAPSVSFTIASQSGGEAGGALTVTVDLSVQAAIDVTIPYSLSGTALDPDDYTVDASPLVISQGSSSGQLTITPVDDSLYELDETVVLTLGTPIGGTLGATTVHTATLTDDDPQPSVDFQFAAQSGLESSGHLAVGIVLSEVSGADVLVPFSVGGSATELIDFVIDTGNPVLIPAGSPSTDVTISISDETLFENDEDVVLTLGTPTDAVLGTLTVHTSTILNDDTPPSVSFTVFTQTTSEEGGGVSIRLELDELSGADASISFLTSGNVSIPQDAVLSSKSIDHSGGAELGFRLPDDLRRCVLRGRPGGPDPGSWGAARGRTRSTGPAPCLHPGYRHQRQHG